MKITEEEQKRFFERIDLPEFEPYKDFFLLEYYFGLRPWELKDVRFEGDFLIALNAKHEEDGEPVYKKIPIPAQLKARMSDRIKFVRFNWYCSARSARNNKKRPTNVFYSHQW